MRMHLTPFLSSWFLLLFLCSLSPYVTAAQDSLPRSPWVGSAKRSLGWYEHTPISKVLANPSAYHLHEIKVTGIVLATQTQVMTQGCAAPYELTVISLEDEGGAMEILDRGVCGRNTSPVRAPMLVAGDRIELLVHVFVGTDTEGKGSSLELFALWIERTQQ